MLMKTYLSAHDIELFIEIVERGCLKALESLLKENPLIVQEQQEVFHETSALNVACNCRHKDIIRCLLEHGADVNQVDEVSSILYYDVSCIL